MDYYNQEWVLWFKIGKYTKWAITLFGNTYYSCPESEVYDQWRKHEDAHKQQQKKERFLFYPKYLYYNLRVGYADNPYEIDAKVKI